MRPRIKDLTLNILDAIYNTTDDSIKIDVTLQGKIKNLIRNLKNNAYLIMRLNPFIVYIIIF